MKKKSEKFRKQFFPLFCDFFSNVPSKVCAKINLIISEIVARGFSGWIKAEMFEYFLDKKWGSSGIVRWDIRRETPG